MTSGGPPPPELPTSRAPLRADSRFRIASITKPIVATLIVAAAADGALSLEDDVAAWVPGLLRPDRPSVTVRMLLDHTSGLFDVGNEGDPIADFALLTDPVLIDEARAVVEAYQGGEPVIASSSLFVATAETHDRYFPPGDGYHYANVNYQLAAMVLEAATGTAVVDRLQHTVIGPLGLGDTSLAPPDLTSPEIRGYGTSVADGSLVDLTDDLTTFGNGASGGIVSTADELLTMMRALVAGELVADEWVDQMKKPTVMSRSSYGLGLATYYLSCGRFVGHEGGVNGTASIAVVSPDGADGVAMVVNLRDGSDLRLAARADEILCARSALTE